MLINNTFCNSLNLYTELYKALEECHKFHQLDNITYKKVCRAIERHSQLKSGGIDTQNSFLSHFRTSLHQVEESRRMLFITNKIGFAIIFYDSLEKPIKNILEHVSYRNAKDLQDFSSEMHTIFSLSFDIQNPERGNRCIFLKSPLMNEPVGWIKSIAF